MRESANLSELTVTSLYEFLTSFLLVVIWMVFLLDDVMRERAQLIFARGGIARILAIVQGQPASPKIMIRMKERTFLAFTT